jgi:hypothetical protein
MSFVSSMLSVLLLASSVASAAAAPSAPLAGPLGLSPDERLDLDVDPDQRYEIVVSDPVPVVPSPALPAGLEVSRSNNNLAIARHDGRLFLAFRTAPIHFASPNARLVVLSSPDLGRSWSLETTFATGRDLREPFLLEVGGQLRLYFVELDERFYRFEALALWRASRCGPGCWTTPERWGGPDEITWDFKVRGGRAWMTSYRNKRYELAAHPVEVRFWTSPDGLGWEEVGDRPVYRGGATETAFEFDQRGALWAVTRNEDGDDTGFGSHVATAEPRALGAWRVAATSESSKFDSPRLFRHGGEIFLVARRHLGPPFGSRFPALSGGPRRLLEWASYSVRPKRTTIYWLDRTTSRVETVVDLPSAGDTAFPSIVRLSPHEFLIANYSSAFRHSDRSWLWGQLNGTGIYFIRVRFEPRGVRAAAAAPFVVPAVRNAAAPGSQDWAALGFPDDWPMRETYSRKMAGLSAVLAGTAFWIRRRRRVRVSVESPRSR